nr:MAG: succinate dehydrogenase/fumarate reductase iron-sulfur subunit [Pseudomonadota bacterium]
MAGTMNVRLRVWRQKDARSPGGFVTYEVQNISPDMSFLEMLDTLNEELIGRGEEPIAFDHDCREGICGMCSLVINGQAHGPTGPGVTTCQLYMRHFRDGEEITVEPFRAKAFPIIRDLVVDRSALDRVVAAGGFISVNTGGAPDANAIPVSKEEADASMDAAACIGCGACVAACPNGSAMLFVGAQISKYLHLPQGRVERERRVVNMVRAMDEQGFGNCTNHRECEAVCPKNIPIKVIAEMNREFIRAKAKGYR